MTKRIRLGVNIDHVATIRNARGGEHPDPVRAAQLAAHAGADGITTHLREDRRHISDDDLDNLEKGITLPLNLEMAATEEMLEIALQHHPHAVCLVPEKREEQTTEGGLDAAGQINTLKPIVEKMTAAGIRVSLFIEPDETQIKAAKALNVPVIELHTGHYANSVNEELASELIRIEQAAKLAKSLNIEVHAGHGLTYENVMPIAALDEIAELNIGHFLIGEAIFIGLEASIKRMRYLMDAARAEDKLDFLVKHIPL